MDKLKHKLSDFPDDPATHDWESEAKNFYDYMMRFERRNEKKIVNLFTEFKKKISAETNAVKRKALYEKLRVDLYKLRESTESDSFSKALGFILVTSPIVSKLEEELETVYSQDASLTTLLDFLKEEESEGNTIKENTINKNQDTLKDTLKGTINKNQDTLKDTLKGTINKNQDTLKGTINKNQDTLKGTINKNEDILKGTINKNEDILKGTINKNQDTLKGTINKNQDTLKGTINKNQDTLKGTINKNEDILKGTINKNEESLKESIKEIKKDLTEEAKEKIIKKAANKMKHNVEHISWTEVNAIRWQEFKDKGYKYKKVFNIMDSITGEDSKYFDSLNQIRPIDEPFEYEWKGYKRVFQHPRDRPYDRGVLIPHIPVGEEEL